MYIYIYVDLYIYIYIHIPAHLLGASGQAFCKVSSLQNVMASNSKDGRVDGGGLVWHPKKHRWTKKRIKKEAPYQVHIQAPRPVFIDLCLLEWLVWKCDMSTVYLSHFPVKTAILFRNLRNMFFEQHGRNQYIYRKYIKTQIAQQIYFVASFVPSWPSVGCSPFSPKPLCKKTGFQILRQTWACTRTRCIFSNSTKTVLWNDGPRRHIVIDVGQVWLLQNDSPNATHAFY